MTPGRNAPCPCGSGKKYKQCCGGGDRRWAQGSAGGASVLPQPAASPVQLLALASRHFNMGQIREADMLCRQILLQQPRNADALNLLGLAEYRSGRHEKAVELLGQAIHLMPENAFFHNNQGNVLQEMRRFDQAEQHFRKAVELRPDFAEFRYNLGNTFQKQGAMEAACESYQRAIALKPGHMQARNNLGLCLRSMEQPDQAAEAFSQAMKLEPADVDAWFNMGNLLREQGRLEEAIPYLEQALKLVPGHANAHFILAVCLLGGKELPRGWKEYGWRFELKESTGPLEKRPFPQPAWKGEPLGDRTLLVWGEQGLGDELMFANVLPDAIRAARHVVVECEPRLAELFARSFPEAEVIGRAYPPQPRLLQNDIDFHAPIGDLPRWFRPALESFPGQGGYLSAAPGKLAHWGRWLAGLPRGPKVGIAWRSMMRGGYRDLHYTELDQWGDILGVPGIVFVNLQYGECREELEEARRLFGVEIHEASGLNLKDDLDEAAALTASLDLVISAGTSVCAMAGALGKPAWMYTFSGVWDRLGADNYPWMPSIRIYEKDRISAWEPLLAQIGTDLREWVRGNSES
ncbi:MAG: tetratricopeptide repeat protein [Sulfuricella denitrificans]|nr:tetratricopeptide repeat protein [Sulfuricella denitrificans]